MNGSVCRDARRAVVIVFLLVGWLCAAAYAAFFFGMEGMRHSYPEPGRLDPFLYDLFAPVVCISVFLCAAGFKMPRMLSALMVAIATFVGGAWIWIHEWTGVYRGTGAAVLLLVIAAAATWKCRRAAEQKRAEVQSVENLLLV
jgi:hypothetical protein